MELGLFFFGIKTSLIDLFKSFMLEQLDKVHRLIKNLSSTTHSY